MVTFFDEFCLMLVELAMRFLYVAVWVWVPLKVFAMVFFDLRIGY